MQFSKEKITRLKSQKLLKQARAYALSCTGEEIQEENKIFL